MISIFSIIKDEVAISFWSTGIEIYDNYDHYTPMKYEEDGNIFIALSTNWRFQVSYTICQNVFSNVLIGTIEWLGCLNNNNVSAILEWIKRVTR